MQLATLITTFAAMAVLLLTPVLASPLLGPNSALTSNSRLSVRQDQYEFKCNELNIPAVEVESCMRDLAARGGEVLKIGIDPPYIHLCNHGSVYINGRAWGEQGGASATAGQVSFVVKVIFDVCGSRGGSAAVTGQTGKTAFIVHVADQWV